MGPKSRGNKAKRTRSVEPAVPVPGPDEVTVHDVTVEGQQILDALVSALTLAVIGGSVDGSPLDLDEIRATDPALDPLVPEDDADESDEVDGEAALAITTLVLARAFLAETLGRQPNTPLPNDPVTPIDDGPGELPPDFINSLTATLVSPDAAALGTLPRSIRDEVVADLGDLVNEVGLEEFDTDCALEMRRSGTSQLFAMPLSAEAAHVYLIPHLLERLESSLLVGDVFPAIERDASSWEFACWNVAPPARLARGEIASLASSIREQEYSLVERRMVSLGMTALDDLLAESIAGMFARQVRIAESYAASATGIYECDVIDGDRALLRSVIDGRVVVVYDPLDAGYTTPGSLCLGRLLPFDRDGVHLRSPGMVVVPPGRPDLARAAVDAFRQYCATLPPSLAVEAVISSVVYEIPVPRPTKAKDSRAQARETIELILEFSEDTEWEDVVGRALASTASDIARPAIIPQYYTPSVHLDTTLEGFFAALVQQASAGKSGDDRNRAQKPRRARRRR